MIKADIVIIGAGFAGAATAWHLAEKGCKNIVILEREELPGMHSSGQNASMARQFEEDTAISRCTFRGAGFILTPPYRWPRLINRVGSLILYKSSRRKSIDKALAFAVGMGLESEIVDGKKVVAKVPVLLDADFDEAIWTVTDGVVDIDKYLWSYLKDAKEKGVSLKLNEEVLNISQNRDKSFAVTTERAAFQCCTLINAAGAWVSKIGQMAGAFDIRFRPLRRHLYNSTVMKNVDPKWPFVWDIDNQYYFRPESGGLLLGPCDEEEVKPGVPSTSHRVREMLAEKLARHCPALSNITISTEWAGLRTFASDRRFVIGEDPQLKNFYWAAGLGGFGMTCSHEIGSMVADAIFNDGKSIPKEFSSDRFTDQTA